LRSAMNLKMKLPIRRLRDGDILRWHRELPRDDIFMSATSVARRAGACHLLISVSSPSAAEAARRTCLFSAARRKVRLVRSGVCRKVAAAVPII